MNSFKSFFTLIFNFLIISWSCHSSQNRKTNPVPLKLFSEYKDGYIKECKYEGKLIFEAGLNAYDAGAGIYDQKGTEIGRCDYAWGSVDSICHALTDCKTVYRVENNIWNEPYINIYHLE